MKFICNQILILYVLIGTIVCNILPIPEILKGFLSMFSFLIIPYLVGNALFQTRFFRDRFIEMDIISHSFLAWFFGFIVITLSVISLYPFHLLNITLYSFVLLILLIIYYFFQYFIGKIWTNGQKYPIHRSDGEYENNKIVSHTINNIDIDKNIILFLIVVGIGYSLFLLFFNPFPLWYDTIDGFSLHIPMVWLLTDYGEFTILSFYIESIVIIPAVASVLFNVDGYTILWNVTHFLFPTILLFGLYFFLINFINKKWAFIGAFAGLWSIHQLYAINPLIIMYAPRVVCFLLLPFAFFWVEKNIAPVLNKNKLNIKSIFFLFLFEIISAGILWSIIKNGPQIGPFVYFYLLLYFILIIFVLFKLLNKNLRFYCFSLFIIFSTFILVHNFVGLLFVILIIAYLFFTYLYGKYPKKSKMFMLFVIGLFVLFFIMQSYGIMDVQRAYFTQPVPSTLTHPQTFDDKFNSLIRQYPIIIITLLFLGIAHIILTSIKRLYSSLTLLVVCLGIMLFSQDAEIYRIIYVIHLFVILFLLYGIVIMLKYFESNHNKKALKFSIILFVFIVLCFSMFNLEILTIEKYSRYLGGNYSLISLPEYDAGNWIKKYIPKNTIIISDKITGSVVSAISHIKRTDTFPIIEESVADALKFQDPKEVYFKVKNITKNEWFTKKVGIWVKGSPYIDGASRHKDWMYMQRNVNSSIIVISARTIECVNSKEPTKTKVCSSWQRMDDKHMRYLSIFFNDTYFTPLYNNSEIYVFGVNPEPGVSFEIQNLSERKV